MAVRRYVNTHPQGAADGRFVEYSDYLAVKRERDTARKANRELRAEIATLRADKERLKQTLESLRDYVATNPPREDGHPKINRQAVLNTIDRAIAEALEES